MQFDCTVKIWCRSCLRRRRYYNFSWKMPNHAPFL